MSGRICRLTVLAAGTLALTTGLYPQDGPAIEESGLGATGETVAEGLQADFDAAMELFNSVNQADSIPLLSDLIATLNGSVEVPDEVKTALLTESLFRRAEAQLNLGENDAATADLETAARVDIGFEPDPMQVSPKLIDLFEEARSRVGGYLQAELEPADAVILADGTEMTLADGAPTPVLAGSYQLTIQRPGYASQAVQVEVEPGTTVPVQATLERDSAVVHVRTVEAGVGVAVDGVARGLTTAVTVVEESGDLPGSGEESAADETGPGVAPVLGAQPAELVVDGLDIGTHMLELSKEGFRTRSMELTVDALTDYDLDVVALEETRGKLLVANIPAEAAMSVDGELLFPAGTVKGDINFPLPVGDHVLEIDAGSLGGFIHRFSLEDREEHSVDVRLRPRLTLLAVIAGDAEARDRVRRSLFERFADHPDWMLVDSTEELDPRLGEISADLDRMHAGDHSGVDWERVQTFAGREAVGSVYLIAVLADDLLASSVELLAVPAAPAAALVDAHQVELQQPETLAAWSNRFGGRPTWARPWLGAQLLDSPLAEGPVVVAVDPTGPFASAGLSAGDVVVSVGRSPTATAADVSAVIALVEPGQTVPVSARRGQSTFEVEVSAVAVDHVFVDLDGDRSAAAIAAWLNIADTRGIAGDWLLALNRAAVYRADRAWPEVVRALRAVEGPEEPGLGRAAIDYWLGVALLETDSIRYQQQAHEAFARAADAVGARLQSADGPRVAPRAQSRLRTLDVP